LTKCRLPSVFCPVSSPPPLVVKCYFGNVIDLVFLGSLSTPFNIESLIYFKDCISPILSKHTSFNFHVCGSNPTKEVLNLVYENGWNLHQNLSDDELDLLLSKMTAGVLPFEYSQGVKLKIWKFFSLGLPVVGTSVFDDYSGVGKFFFSSNNYEDWAVWLKGLSVDYSIQSHTYWSCEVGSVKEQVVKSLT
jgi:hypothetical protein